MTLTNEQLEITLCQRAALDRLPTADEVRELFSRFTMALWVIGEHADLLAYPASRGAMPKEVAELEALIGQVLRDVSGIAAARTAGGSTFGPALTLAAGIMRAPSFSAAAMEHSGGWVCD